MIGGRWRCLVCEDYVSYDDLELCWLTQDLTVEFKSSVVAGERDRIEFCANGTYRLLGVRKQRYAKKRSATDASVSKPVVRKKSAPAEVIVLD